MILHDVNENDYTRMFLYGFGICRAIINFYMAIRVSSLFSSFTPITHSHLLVSIHMHTRVHVYTYVITHTHNYTYTFTHTHKQHYNIPPSLSVHLV